MTRLQLIFCLCTSLLWGACQPAGHHADQEHRLASESETNNTPRRADFPLVLLLAPARAVPDALLTSLRSELHEDFDVHTLELELDGGTNQLEKQLPELKPHVVVLVDNPTVALYRTWARSNAAPPPAIIVMASFAEQLHLTVPNSTGIAFEPPAVTVLSDLRRLLRTPIRRAGVVYREGFESFIARERQRLAAEKIDLIAVSVSPAPTARSLNRALRELEAENVQALWVVNDNVLLSPALLSQAWLPLAQQGKIPIVVGVPSLVTNRPHFGTYAAVPDLEGLGLQAADLVYELEGSGWDARATAVQPPVSIKTYVDLAQARQLGLLPEDDQLIDVLVREDP